MIVSAMILKLIRRYEHDSVKPVESSIDAINAAVKFLSLRLAERGSDLAKCPFTDTFSTQTTPLPPDFNGFCGLPTVNSIPLDPVPADASGIPATATVPTHYEVVGGTLYVYPTPTTEITVDGSYWLAPPVLTASGTIPYSGLFDDTLFSIAAQFGVFGHAVLSDRNFLAGVEQALDLVLDPRKPALPRNRPFNSF